MALVAYDYDSSSDNEQEEEENEETPAVSAVIIPKKNVETVESRRINTDSENPKINTNSDSIEENKTSIPFSTLPQTKIITKGIVEDQIEDFIPKPDLAKKNKQKVKITIPSLSQFQDSDDDEPESKKIKPSTSGSGLLSLLPPVKGAVKTATSFIPKVITDKTKAPATSTNSLVPHSVRKIADAKKSAVLQKAKRKAKVVLSDAESDDDLDVPETFDDEMWEKICGRPKNKPTIQEPEPELQQEVINIAPEPEKPYDGLDNKAFKELVGKSRRPIGNIKLIDIHEEEITADKDLWMAKSLTDPEMAPKAAIDDPVDPTRRKKHHITYLAQQAKANEQDLKNAWASSKNNRNASRSKYGF